MTALWKQESSLHPTFDALNRCLADDWFLLPFELKLQRAHAQALEAAGILSPLERQAVDRGLDDIASKCDAARPPASDAEDIHTWVESELVRRIGDAGKKIHTARSRNDQVATLLKMYVNSAGERLRGDLRGLAEMACRRARDWSELPMPLHTHQQFAAPGNAGFWVLRFAVAFDRIQRHWGGVLEVWRRYCPLGSGAVAGSSIPIDRRIQARELGFAAPSLNALDSTSTRDECLELLFLASQTALHLQSFAADVILYSQTPLGWTKYPQEFGTGSSMMPNKMNPDAMELLRGEANAILAAHVQAMMLLKGLPSGYNRDLQCIKPLVRGAAERLHALCELALAFLERLDFDKEALAASMGLGRIDATLRMEQKVMAGALLREAHHAVAGEAPVASPQLPGGAADWLRMYQTSSSANPAETRRIADAILAELHA
jgi:argininosuccinate lyase